MAMVRFLDYFPELGIREMRSLRFSSVVKVPRGEYGLLEFYCNEADCDCRRVHLQVVSPPGFKVWANINYGWEKPDFYREWGSDEDEEYLCGPFLDPLNPQSRYAKQFLEVITEFLADDEDYVRRLARHYGMMKGLQMAPAVQPKRERERPLHPLTRQARRLAERKQRGRGGGLDEEF